MPADRRVNQSNGTPRAPVQEVSEDQTNENIFLFVPNLIGMINEYRNTPRASSD